MNVGYVGVARPDVGISLKSSGGKTIISGIRAESPGVDAGLSVNDEIIGVNGFRIDSKSLSQYFNSLSNGETLDVLYSRDNLLGITELKAELYEKPKYEYSFGTGKATQKLLEYWLRTND
jgi:predicted metalloprotease with PDZ domain